MAEFRTQKNENKYIKELKNKRSECPICDRVGLKTFKYWKIIKNDFPYDRIAKKHDMLVPIRHVIENDLNQKELDELRKIKNSFIKDSNYDYIIESNYKMKSLPTHFHLHLIVLK